MFQKVIKSERLKNTLEIRYVEIVTHASTFHYENNKYSQKKSFESLVLCKSTSNLNIPLYGENTLDLSRDGEYILASNKSIVCCINTKRDLYSPLYRKNNRNESCCDSYSIKHTSLTDLKKLCIKLNYKKRCTSALWYSPDNMIFLTSGDTNIDIWDNSLREITYSFSNLPSLVNCMSIANTKTNSPPIAGGLKCGTISMCDIRYGSATNLCKPSFSAEISVLKFLKDNENQLIAGYDNSTILIWDLRKFNRPIHNISNTHSTKQESLIYGCSVNIGTGNTGSRTLVEKHSIHFDNEEEIWDYIREYENSPDLKRKMYDNIGKEMKIDNEVKNNDKRKAKLGDIISLGRKGKEKNKFNFPENKDKMLPNYLSKKSKELESEVIKERKDTPTDIKISDVDFNIYISYKNGFIDCYNSSTFKQIKSIDVNKYLKDFGEGLHPSRYLQKMKIQLICKDSFVMFNNMECVGLINLKDESFCKYIKIINEDQMEPTQEISNLDTPNGTSCQMPMLEVSPRNIRTLHDFHFHFNYVTDITTMESTREIYVGNERGQIFVLHPDYKQLFKK